MTYEYWATGARSRGTKAPAIPILPHFNFLTVYIFVGSFNTEFANVLFQSQLNLVFKRTDKPAGGEKSFSREELWVHMVADFSGHWHPSTLA